MVKWSTSSRLKEGILPRRSLHNNGGRWPSNRVAKRHTHQSDLLAELQCEPQVLPSTRSEFAAKDGVVFLTGWPHSLRGTQTLLERQRTASVA